VIRDCLNHKEDKETIIKLQKKIVDIRLPLVYQSYRNQNHPFSNPLATPYYTHLFIETRSDACPFIVLRVPSIPRGSMWDRDTVLASPQCLSWAVAPPLPPNKKLIQNLNRLYFFLLSHYLFTHFMFSFVCSMIRSFVDNNYDLPNYLINNWICFHYHGNIIIILFVLRTELNMAIRK
jgi:hypothetical protein